MRSTLDCGGSTPPWNNIEEQDSVRSPMGIDDDKTEGGVEPPQSKVFRTDVSMRVALRSASRNLRRSGTRGAASVESRKLRKPSRIELPAGFSLIELVVAMAIFLVVGGTALTLFSRHETLLSQEQGTAGLNIGLRNALSQIQIDVVNGGSGVLTGAQIPAWPVGVTITNSNPNASPICSPATTGTYSANCFDALNVVMVDPNTPPLQLVSTYGSPTGTTCLNTNASSCTASPVTLTSTTTNTVTGSVPTGYTASTVATDFKAGDYVLFVDVAQQVGEQDYTIAKLASAGGTSGSNVQLTFDETQQGGFNYGATSGNDPLGVTTPYCYVNTTSGSPTVTWASGSYNFVTGSTWANQPIQISNTTYTVASVSSTTSLTLSSNATATLSSAPFLTTTVPTNQFYSGDWVLRLLPIQYSVSVSNAADPQLVRTQAGVTNVVMDQVIGFKVGAVWWNSTLALNDFQYDYNSTDYNNNFSLVRAVRVSIIGRTTPSSDPTYTYVNSFDGGRYQIRGSSIVVNPRNLTMSND
ncbi:MAG: PilW family protein [Terriglobia bacterium]